MKKIEIKVKGQQEAFKGELNSLYEVERQGCGGIIATKDRGEYSWNILAGAGSKLLLLDLHRSKLYGKTFDVYDAELIANGTFLEVNGEDIEIKVWGDSFTPKQDERYYYCYASGELKFEVFSTFADLESEDYKRRKAIGNIFQTECEAKTYAEMMSQASKDILSNR